VSDHAGSTAATDAPRPLPRSARSERRLELAVTILLAAATVAAAWSSYQSARWSGVQTINFSKANASRVESTRRSALAGQQTQVDVSTFIAWVDAYSAGDKQRSDRATAQAKIDNQRSDNYVLALVLFASALFFAGISTKLNLYQFRVAIVAMGYAVFLGTLIWLATFPITVAI